MIRLLPNIYITDVDGNAIYTYKSDGSQKDFKLTYCMIHNGINIEHGMAKLLIDDRHNELTNILDPNRPSKLKPGYLIRIELYDPEHLDDMRNWFSGVINEARVVRPMFNMQYLSIVAIGWGSVTANRIGRIDFEQRLLEDGITRDSNDLDADIDAIIKRLFSNYLDVPSLVSPQITNGDIQTLGLKLPSYRKLNVSIGSILQELVNIGGAVYTIDPDKKLNVYRRNGERSSDMMISNNPNENWLEGKLLITRNKSYSWSDSIIDSGYNIIHATGSQKLQITSSGPALADADSSLDLHDSDIILEYETDADNLFQVELYIQRNADVTEPLAISIIGLDRDGIPDLTSLKQRMLVSKYKINAIPQSGGWLIVRLNEKEKINPDRPVAILVEKYPQNETLSLVYKKDVGKYWAYINNVWIELAGSLMFSTLSARTQKIVAHSTANIMNELPKEIVIALDGEPVDDAAIVMTEAIINSKSRHVRRYETVRVLLPDTRPTIGKTIRIKDNFSSLDTSATLTGYDIIISGTDTESAGGAVSMSLMLEELI